MWSWLAHVTLLAARSDLSEPIGALTIHSPMCNSKMMIPSNELVETGDVDFLILLDTAVSIRIS